MSRKKIKNRKKTHGDALKPFTKDGIRYYPLETQGGNVLDPSGVSSDMNQDQFMHMTHEMSDTQLNDLLCRQVQDVIDMGLNPDWPEDDFGIVMWFTWSFLTDEMREAFPAIAREYLEHEELIDKGEEYQDIPYPVMNETTWHDAYYFRVLSIMLMSARKGSVYSKNYLLSLYKVYYRQEYNRLKKLKTLHYRDLLEIFDDDCRRKGYASGHTTDGNKSFAEETMARRRREAGWTNATGARLLVYQGSKSNVDVPNKEIIEASSKHIQSVNDSPDEPPIQPVASRLFVMCELLNIPIDETCNQQAAQTNELLQSMLNVTFLSDEIMRQNLGELTERNRDFCIAAYPELASTERYQNDEKYLALEMSEIILTRAFAPLGRNWRIPYDSRKFDLATEISKIMVWLHLDFPGFNPSMVDMQYLAMIHYLGECVCDVMIVRDEELDELLHFHRRRHQGEWTGKAGEEFTEEVKDATPDLRQEKFLKSAQQLRDKRDEPAEEHEGISEEDLGEEELKQEIARLQAELAEKEAALAENQQKLIRQRVLYEKADAEAKALREAVSIGELEHTELVALREYVYNLKVDEQIDEDENQDAMIEALQDKNVIVLGGIERWCKRMKRIFPKWSFISADDERLGSINAVEKADFVYIYTSALKHTQYYRAMNIVKSSNKMLFYLGSSNTHENIRRFYRDLCERWE